jgi:hypothetical protein
MHFIPSYLSKIHFDIVHPPSSWSFLVDLPPISYMHSSSPPSCYMPRPSHPSWLDYSDSTWRIRALPQKLIVIQLVKKFPTPFVLYVAGLRAWTFGVKWSLEKVNVLLHFLSPFLCEGRERWGGWSAAYEVEPIHCADNTRIVMTSIPVCKTGDTRGVHCQVNIDGQCHGLSSLCAVVTWNVRYFRKKHDRLYGEPASAVLLQAHGLWI